MRRQAEFQMKRSNEMALRESAHGSESRRLHRFVKVGSEVLADRNEPGGATGAGTTQGRAAREQTLEHPATHGYRSTEPTVRCNPATSAATAHHTARR